MCVPRAVAEYDCVSRGIEQLLSCLPEGQTPERTRDSLVSISDTIRQPFRPPLLLGQIFDNLQKFMIWIVPAVSVQDRATHPSLLPFRTPPLSSSWSDRILPTEVCHGSITLAIASSSRNEHQVMDQDRGVQRHSRLPCHATVPVRRSWSRFGTD